MVFSRDYVLAPHIVRVGFTLAPAVNILDSMHLLSEVDAYSGFSDWVTTTAAHMSEEQLRRTRLVFGALEMIIYQHMNPAYNRFEAFLDAVAAEDPYQLVETLWDELAKMPTKYPEHWSGDKPAPSRDALKNDRQVYIDFMTTVYYQHGDAQLWDEAYDLLQDPPRARTLVLEHLQTLYEEYVEPEWKRVQPMLQESVTAFQKLDYSNLTVFEAIRAVTGRDITSKPEINVEAVESVVFIPAAHIGPYIATYIRDQTLYVSFGARLPHGVQSASSDLSRAELLIRLNALADDSRLRILELLTQHDEMCAQDIIEQLGLSQPTISRHLSQLTATGYIIERRRDVAKCYSLNSDRVNDTLRALSNFLSRQ